MYLPEAIGIMGSDRISNKAEAGRGLVAVDKEIVAMSRSLNKVALIPMLLCLEDAINNFEIQVLKHDRVYEVYDNIPELRFAIVQFIREWYKIVDDSIASILNNGFSAPSRFTRMPLMGFGICFNKSLDKCIELFINLGYIEKNETVFCKPRVFLNKFDGQMIIGLKTRLRKYIRNMDRIFRLRNLFFRKGLLVSMLYILPEGASLEFDETGLMKTNLPEGTTAMSVFEQRSITPRLLETYTFVYDWNSHFREVGTETLQSVNIGKNKNNLDYLKKEDEEIFQSYNLMRNYPETFREEYGIDLKSFFYIISQIVYLCYPRPHTIGAWTRDELVKEERLRGYQSEDINATLMLLSRNTQSDKNYVGFISLDGKIYTSFRRLCMARIILLEKCFGEVYENDLKGRNFEEACRKLLVDREFSTLPDRVDVHEPMLPPEVTSFLWGKEKRRSDIDVISCKGNKIIVLECKEIKSSKLEKRQVAQFKKYLIEHYYKTKWICANLEKFNVYAGGEIYDKLCIDTRQPIYLFPILVTNLLVILDEIRETPLITYTELQEAITSCDFRIEDGGQTSGSLEITVKGRKIGLPWLLKCETKTVL
jgi:hypothetical protein